eukprot:6492397-Amphidinium_carterae.5
MSLAVLKPGVPARPSSLSQYELKVVARELANGVLLTPGAPPSLDIRQDLKHDVESRVRARWQAPARSNPDSILSGANLSRPSAGAPTSVSQLHSTVRRT